MRRLACLAALAAVLPGCKCARKEPEGPVARPATVHAWAGLAHLDKTLEAASALAGKFGLPAPGKDVLHDALAHETGLPRDALSHVDLGRPLWTAGVKSQGVAPAYTYVYALPLREERAFREPLAPQMSPSGRKGISKLAPRNGTPEGPVFLAVDRGYALACKEAAALEVARDFLLRTLAPRPIKDDLSITLTRGFMAGWRKGIADLAEGQEPALGSFVRRMGERVANIDEATLRLRVAPEEVVVDVRLQADGGPMQSVIQRQVPGPVSFAELMPEKTWLFYADRHSSAALAEATLDVKEAFAHVPAERREKLVKAVGDLAGALSGEVAVGVTGSAVLAAAAVRDAKVARTALDILIAGLTGGSPARQEGGVSVVDLPLPAGFVPPLISGRPAVARLVDEGRLLLAVGIGAEQWLREAAAAGAGSRLDKHAAFAKAASPDPRRVGLLYLSLAEMLGAMLAAVPGAPTPPTAGDTPGVVLAWGVDEGKKAIQVTLRVPADAFATLGPAIQSLPFVGGGPAMPGAPWKPGR